MQEAATPQPSHSAPLETDALVVGAGPVGLFMVFQLGLQEVKAHVVDAMPQPGGQPAALYPDKLIFDIPAVPACTGHELTERLLQQIAPFEPTFHMGQLVSEVQPQADGRFAVTTSIGLRFLTKTLFIAGGVGAFEPRKLNAPGLDVLEGRSVFHGTAEPAQPPAQGTLLVLGDDDDALDCAMDLARSSANGRVLLMHRRDAFSATPERVARMRDLCARGYMTFMVGQVTGVEAEGGTLTAALVLGPDGETHRVPVSAMLVRLGFSPRLGPIAHWGLDMARKQLVVDTEKFATSTPGIFAVGDVNTYPGKRKLIVCGFHECTLAAFGAMSIIRPQAPVWLQYTTTSPRLLRLLESAPR